MGNIAATPGSRKIRCDELQEGDLTKHYLVMKTISWHERIYLTVRYLPDGPVTSVINSPDHEVELIWRKEDERHRAVGKKVSHRS